jgi:hypothetical protein
MRDNREQNYGNFSREYEQEHPSSQERRFEEHDSGRRYENRGSGQRYRPQQSHEFGRRGGEQGMREDYYNTMYDISNYTAVPRADDYGLPYGSENDLDQVRRGNPFHGDPDAFERTRYRYSSGYNPNYDNPEEGDMYRNFDSRGNFGYRHDPSYGTADEFRDFGDDHYGRRDTGNMHNGYFEGYNR